LYSIKVPKFKEICLLVYTHGFFWYSGGFILHHDFFLLLFLAVVILYLDNVPVYREVPMQEITSRIRNLNEIIRECGQLLQKLSTCTSLQEKLHVLDESERVKNTPFSDIFLKIHSPENLFVAKAIIAIGQEKILSNFSDEPDEKINRMLEKLFRLEKFYDSLGGIIGYHKTVLELTSEKEEGCSKNNPDVRYLFPGYFDIQTSTPDVYRAVLHAIENLPFTGEMYPIGGAGERLKLIDPETKESLPAALLPFMGRTLFCGLLRDVQAKEFLYWKLYGKNIRIPIALMTSEEKNNRKHMERICNEKKRFGRPKTNFFFFDQIPVPVVSEFGNWIMEAPFSPMMKPGGHGMVWKLAEDEGVFDWFKSFGSKKIFIRQINNPIACMDYGALATMGFCFSQNKSFGVASCGRMPGSPEGMNVLREEKTDSGYEYAVTNIEYTEFKIKGIDDSPSSPSEIYSPFPTNTNILCVDIEAIRSAIKILPVPGMIINMKSKYPCFDSEGVFTEVHGGRLESTMQNIAEVMTDTFSSRAEYPSELQLKTFLSYNERDKVISVAKECHEEGKNIQGTPLGAYQTLQKNYMSLLSEICGIEVSGSGLIVDFHPALGPLWSIIGQKIRGGKYRKKFRVCH